MFSSSLGVTNKSQLNPAHSTNSARLVPGPQEKHCLVFQICLLPLEKYVFATIFNVQFLILCIDSLF